ncbi:hypothetical protein KAR91_17800 [Candidatus Pacearchaeota archaeon]|nr:hypothetical protein [Candidatus Pacearchaeota archaeon]
MTVIAPPARSAFPGAKSIVDYNQSNRRVSERGIIEWGVDGVYVNFTFFFTSASGLFVTKGLGAGLILYIVGANPTLRFSTLVTGVLNETTLQVQDNFGGNFNACRYKLGTVIPYTIEQMVKQMKDTDGFSTMFRWGRVWSDAPVQAFAKDETGELLAI